ncbi:MAG: hypothetical protein PHT79_01270 [Syntrophomonadaceae bacterium]|nr:hypothetical protein [Syntrophomonadaceae bacterium]
MVDKQKVVKKLKEMFPDGKISCSEARGVADELGVKLGEMGELCDEAGIKVFGCELGCF